jgi:hypothetical protein
MLSELTHDWVVGRLRTKWGPLGTTWRSAGPHWSHALLRWFEKEGADLGYRVRSDPARPEGAYLVDLAWTLEPEARLRHDGVYSGLVLALECEESPQRADIVREFDKLLDLKADLKVLLCAPKPSEVADLRDRLSREIRAHRRQLSDEQYLVVVFTETKGLAWLFDSTGKARDLDPVPYPLLAG